MSVWTASPSGKDLSIAKGQYIAVVASISKGMTKSAVMAHVPSGVEILSYAEQGDGSAPGLGPDPDSSRKYIAVVAHASSWSGGLSWSKSILWDNLYTIVSAWTAPAGASPPAEPPFPSPRGPSEGSGWGWFWGIVGLSGAGYGVYRWWENRHDHARLQRRLARGRKARV